MCLICQHYTANKLTSEEAFRNMEEMVKSGAIDDIHQAEIVGLIMKNEMDDIYQELDFNLTELFI